MGAVLGFLTERGKACIPIVKCVSLKSIIGHLEAAAAAAGLAGLMLSLMLVPFGMRNSVVNT